eukprot:scaffold61712_cov69-Phaeocystis_antarctica.AAC.8
MGASRLAELAQRRGATKGAGEAHGRGRHLLCECARRPRALKSGRAQDDEGFELPSLVCAYAAAKGEAPLSTTRWGSTVTWHRSAEA